MQTNMAFGTIDAYSNAAGMQSRVARSPSRNRLLLPYVRLSEVALHDSVIKRSLVGATPFDTTAF